MGFMTIKRINKCTGEMSDLYIEIDPDDIEGTLNGWIDFVKILSYMDGQDEELGEWFLLKSAKKIGISKEKLKEISIEVMTIYLESSK